MTKCLIEYPWKLIDQRMCKVTFTEHSSMLHFSKILSFLEAINFDFFLWLVGISFIYNDPYIRCSGTLLTWKGYCYLLLDGHTSRVNRGFLNEQSNRLDYNAFLFLLRCIACLFFLIIKNTIYKKMIVLYTSNLCMHQYISFFAL